MHPIESDYRASLARADRHREASDARRYQQNRRVSSPEVAPSKTLWLRTIRWLTPVRGMASRQSA
jgi:hypothetical protein